MKDGLRERIEIDSISTPFGDADASRPVPFLSREELCGTDLLKRYSIGGARHSAEAAPHALFRIDDDRTVIAFHTDRTEEASIQTNLTGSA